MASPSTPRIAVLGSLNMDLVSYVSHHPQPGETLMATSFAVSPGGKVVNQAVACAKLSRSRDGTGAPTATISMLGAVGDDAHGALLRSALENYDVDVAGVQVRTGSRTGIAVIIVDTPTGENRIILSPGANHTHGPADYARTEALGTPRPDLLVAQLEIPLDTVLIALEGARRGGVPVLLNPAPAVTLPDETYRGLAHLAVNETEAEVLSGCEVGTAEGLARAGRWFVDRGVENVVVTLGSRGAYFVTRAGEQGSVPAEKVVAVDTTAAGDTFVGQYALEVVATPPGTRFDIVAAVRKASRAAARTVEHKGAQDSIPWRDELA